MDRCEQETKVNELVVTVEFKHITLGSPAIMGFLLLPTCLHETVSHIYFGFEFERNALFSIKTDGSKNRDRFSASAFITPKIFIRLFNSYDKIGYC